MKFGSKTKHQCLFEVIHIGNTQIMNIIGKNYIDSSYKKGVKMGIMYVKSEEEESMKILSAKQIPFILLILYVLFRSRRSNNGFYQYDDPSHGFQVPTLLLQESLT